MSLFGLSTSNPAFSGYFWNSPNSKPKAQKMSLSGVILKSLFCLILVCIAAGATWKLHFDGIEIKWFTFSGMLVAIVCSILISVRRSWTPWLTIIYAIAKGFFVGGFSAYVHAKYPNLPFQAVGMTLITFIVMLVLYRTGVIVVTKKFRSVVITVTTAIFVTYLITWILSFFGIYVEIIRGTSNFAIAFNIVAAIFASLSLLLDFDFIDRYLGKAHKSYEWFATWGFLVTIIWLYVEILRLLRKLAIRF